MLIKEANHDDNSRFYNYEKNKHLFEAGKDGERDAAYHIDLALGESKNWAIIHDLRLKHNNSTAQIDHLIINRFLEFYVVETKRSVTRALHINEVGEFSYCDESGNPIKAMKSPIEQNKEHIMILEKVMSSVEMPKRLGIRLNPIYHQYVLISSEKIIHRPEIFDTSKVVKTEAFISAMFKRDELKDALSLAKAVSCDTLKSVAEKVASLHQGKITHEPLP